MFERKPAFASYIFHVKEFLPGRFRLDYEDRAAGDTCIPESVFVFLEAEMGSGFFILLLTEER